MSHLHRKKRKTVHRLLLKQEPPQIIQIIINIPIKVTTMEVETSLHISVITHNNSGHLIHSINGAVMEIIITKKKLCIHNFSTRDENKI